MKDDSRKTYKVKVQNVKTEHPVDELGVATFGHATIYVAHHKLMKDLHWELNPLNLLGMGSSLNKNVLFMQYKSYPNWQ